MSVAARFYPGLESMLLTLKSRGIRLAVATHGGERYVGAVAKRLDYPSIFDRVFYHAFQGMTSKAEMARRAMTDLSESNALFVGDRRADRDAAREAGIPFIGCSYGYGADGEIDGADWTVESSEELARLFLSNRHL